MPLLGRQNLLREPDGVDGTQRRSARRQTSRAQSKVGVKGVVTRAGRIVNARSLVRTDRLTVVIEADHRASVVANEAPVFQEAEEVVHPAVRSEVLRLSGYGRERNALARNNRGAVRRGSRRSVVNVVGKRERVHVVPIVGEKRHRVAFDRCRYANAAPGSVVHRRVVIALNVNRVFGNDGETVGAASGGSDSERGAVYDFQSAPEENRGIFPGFLGVAVGNIGTVGIGWRAVRVGKQPAGVGGCGGLIGDALQVSAGHARRTCPHADVLGRRVGHVLSQQHVVQRRGGGDYSWSHFDPAIVPRSTVAFEVFTGVEDRVRAAVGRIVGIYKVVESIRPGLRDGSRSGILLFAATV